MRVRSFNSHPVSDSAGTRISEFAVPENQKMKGPEICYDEQRFHAVGGV